MECRRYLRTFGNMIRIRVSLESKKKVRIGMRPNVFRSCHFWIYAPASMHNNNRCDDNKLKSDSSVASHLFQLHDLSYAQMIWSKEKERDTKKVTEDQSPTSKSHWQKDEPVIPWLLCSKLRFKVCYALSRQKVDSIRPVTLPGVVHDIARTAPCPASWSLRTMSSGCLLLVPWKFKFK